MKLRFFPKRVAVLGLLVKRLEVLKDECDRANAEVERLSNSPLVHNSLDAVKSLAELSKQAFDEAAEQIALLESHGPDEVMCEIDL